MTNTVDVTAMISFQQWPNNAGHVLVVPNEHFENLYVLPDHLGARIHELSRKLALAMKNAYDCDGVSTRQHNEPAGDQEVWHYHQHVFPRYRGDALGHGLVVGRTLEHHPIKTICGYLCSYVTVFIICPLLFSCAVNHIG